jgi:putative secretion ATPase (PEP-CTERM system associated)
MYLELFGLSEMPFRLTPDPHFLFASKQHARAKAYMESTIWLADGFVVITGEIGSGKTTLIESFLAELPENVILAQISQTQLSPVEFLQALLVEFGFKPFRQKKIELLATLRDFMIEQYAAGKTLLLVIDEAQNLSRRVLEEVRMLSGIESQKDKLLRIILAGQPELARKLESPNLEQLRQRVRLMFHLSALSKRETREYIEHRLRIAGAQGRQIIKDDAYDLIFRYTGGIPRLTNILCDTAMLCAFADETNTVTAELVKAAVEELQWVPYSERRSADDGSHAPDGAFVHPVSHLARFDVLFRDQVVADFPVALGRAIIGRTTDNDLQIRSKFVSRHHAQIITTAQASVIEDLNSTNGIFVRSRRVKHHDLVEGDVVQIGEHKLLYHDLRGQNLSTAELEELEEAEDLNEDAEEDDELVDEERDDEDEDESESEADNQAAPRAE